MKLSTEIPTLELAYKTMNTMMFSHMGVKARQEVLIYRLRSGCSARLS